MLYPLGYVRAVSISGDWTQEDAMSLHSLLSVTIGVPNVPETAAYYTDFGLTPGEDGWFSTADAGRQLRLRHAPIRRLLELKVGADDADDLASPGRTGCARASLATRCSAARTTLRARPSSPRDSASKSATGSRRRRVHALLH